MKITEFLNHLQGVKKTAGGWTANCSAHADKQASLSLSEGEDGRILLKCFGRCDIESVVHALGLEMRDLFNKESVCLSYHPIQDEQVSRLAQISDNKGNSTDKTCASSIRRFAQVSRLQCTLKDYATAKKLEETFLKSLAIAESTYRGQTKLVIPYFDEKGELICNRYRLSMAADKKFAWEKGAHPCLHGLWQLKNYNGVFVVLVEGESDCQTLWFNEIPALGLPGASTFKEDRDAPHLEKFKTVYVVVEPDKGGETILKSISNSRIKERVKLVTLPFKDVSELWLDDTEHFKERFDKALFQAVPFLEYEREQIAKQELEAWQKCKGLAQQENILNSVYDEVRRMGVTGEEQTVKLLYLAMVSRYLNRPVSVAIKGPSAAGKSYLLDAIVKLFPEDAYYPFTAMSDHTLAFTEAEFKHRVILLAEASGLSSDFQSYLIRSLLSEGRILYETVEKTKDGLRSRRIEKEGPTGFICTTTAIHLHPENETRMISLTANDTREQTKAILLALAGNHNQECNSMKRWHALQRWLGTQTKDVEIPYAMELAERIPPVAVRLRRDFTALLNLIKRSAILHQYSRARNKNGEIVATIEDYRIVHKLINDLISEGVEATVPGDVREVVVMVAKIINEEEYATTKEVASHLQIDRQAADRRLRRAARLNYLKNNNPGRGKMAQYVVGDSMPDDIQILPHPETLTCSPAQTCVNGVDQVEQTDTVEKTITSENLLTCSPEMEGMNKHKHLIRGVGEIDYVGI